MPRGRRGYRPWANYLRYPSYGVFYGGYPYGLYNYPSTVVVEETTPAKPTPAEDKHRIWMILGPVLAVLIALVIASLLINASRR